MWSKEWNLHSQLQHHSSNLTNLGPRPAGWDTDQNDAPALLEKLLARDASALNRTRYTYNRVYLPKPRAPCDMNLILLCSN